MSSNNNFVLYDKLENIESKLEKIGEVFDKLAIKDILEKDKHKEFLKISFYFKSISLDIRSIKNIFKD